MMVGFADLLMKYAKNLNQTPPGLKPILQSNVQML